MSDLLRIGSTALQAYGTALSTTSHNVANAGTAGYSRQRVDLATQPVSGRIGNGVQPAQVRRLTDTWLQSRLTDDGAAASRHGVARDLLVRADGLMSDAQSGLAPPLTGLNSAVQALMADPSSLSARQSLLSQAQAVTERFAQIDQGLQSLDQEIDGRLQAGVAEANQWIDRIDALNRSITLAVPGNGGQPPADLLDQRDEAVRQLASVIGVRTVTQDNGSLGVYLEDGQALVLDGQARHLSVAPTSAAGRYTLRLEGTGGSLAVGRPAGGAIAGLLDARAQAVDAPRASMTALATDIADAFNAAQASGRDLDGNAGADLFAVPPLSLAVQDPRALALAGAPPAGLADNGAWSAVAAWSGAPMAARAGEVVGALGQAAYQADARASAAASLAVQSRDALGAVAGVNLDEEAADLLRYQQAYQAAAQMIATADTVFQTLLNAVR
jgi:flagellar hook-associated protein 1